MSVKMTLLVPTKGKKIGDEIEVADAKAADALVANGTAARKAEKPATKG